MKSTRWSIGDVAERFGLPTNVLRHWESMGLVSPERDSGGRRRYAEEDVTRVAVIVRSKAAGMSLEQIRSMLDPDPWQRHQVLEEHLVELDRRMTEMRASREMTLHALRCRAHDITNCPRFSAHVEDLLADFA